MKKLKLSIIFTLTVITINVQAEEWKTLSDEASRADLFYRIIQGYQIDNSLPALSDEKAKDFALQQYFYFPRDAQFDTNKKPRKNSLFIVDINHYTDKSIALDRLRKQGVIGVYAKASQGTNFRDPNFSYFWGELGKLSGPTKVYRGAYHFLSSTADGEEQAKSFIRLIKENGGAATDDLPPVVDLEWDVRKNMQGDNWIHKTPEQILSSVKAFLHYIETNGGLMKKPMIYTTRTWWMERIGNDARFADLKGYQIWIADYSKSSRAIEVPNVPNNAYFDMWQFTSNAKLGVGYQNALDASIFKGTEEDFKARFVVKK